MLSECASFDLKLENYKVLDVIVNETSIKNGFWVILQEADSEKVIAKCFKFSAEFSNNYTCGGFELKEADYGNDLTEEKLSYVDLGVNGKV